MSFIEISINFWLMELSAFRKTKTCNPVGLAFIFLLWPYQEAPTGQRLNSILSHSPLITLLVSSFNIIYLNLCASEEWIAHSSWLSPCLFCASVPFIQTVLSQNRPFPFACSYILSFKTGIRKLLLWKASLDLAEISHLYSLDILIYNHPRICVSPPLGCEIREDKDSDFLQPK